MPVQGVLNLICELQRRGLNDDVFQAKLHHQGGDIQHFREYAEGRNFFIKDKCNQLLYKRLEYMFARCEEGALRNGNMMSDLADEAKQAIPCQASPKCKKHITDLGCAKNK